MKKLPHYELTKMLRLTQNQVSLALWTQNLHILFNAIMF